MQRQNRKVTGIPLEIDKRNDVMEPTTEDELFSGGLTPVLNGIDLVSVQRNRR
jgi:hypothetical protein